MIETVESPLADHSATSNFCPLRMLDGDFCSLFQLEVTCFELISFKDGHNSRSIFADLGLGLHALSPRQLINASFGVKAAQVLNLESSSTHSVK